MPQQDERFTPNTLPPQTWVELTTQHGSARSFLGFWAYDYFRFKAIDGVVVPTCSAHSPPTISTCSNRI